MYQLVFNINIGEVLINENSTEYRLSDFRCEAESADELNYLCNDSFVDFDNEKIFLIDVDFINEKFKLNMIYNQEKLRLINLKVLYENYADFDSILENIIKYFDETEFSNKQVDGVKPYIEYFYNWGVVSVYSDQALNVYFSIRWISK